MENMCYTKNKCMTFAPATIAPVTNVNVKPNPIPNPNPYPYTTLNHFKAKS